MTRRRLLRALGAPLLLLVIFLAAAPWLFRDRIEAALQAEASRQLDAEVSWDGLHLDFFRAFPNLSAGVDGLSVVNRAPFEDVPLAAVERLRVVVDLRSLLGDGPLEVRSVTLDAPVLDLRVDAEGRANWALATAGGDGPSAEGQPADFRLDLQAYAIRRARLRYRDPELAVEARDLAHEGRGDFSASRFTLDTRTAIGSLDLAYGGTDWLRGAELALDAALDVDLAEGVYTLSRNELALNALRLALQGRAAERADGGYDLDLAWSSPGGEIDGLLSLLPEAVVGDLRGVRTSGTAAFSGTVAGALAGERLPALALDARVTDGAFSYPDLPGAAEGLQLDLHVERPEGDASAPLLVDLRRLDGRWAGQPFALRLKAADALGHPVLDGALDADLDLAALQRVVPATEGSLEGRAVADLRLKGALDDLEAGRYGRVEAGGTLALEGLRYAGPGLPHPVTVDRMETAFTPAFWRVDRLEGLLGSSRYTATGRLDNLLSWWFRDSVLAGQVDLAFGRLDLNEWLVPAGGGPSAEGGPPAEARPADAGPSPAAVAALPDGVRLGVTARADEVLYENLTLRALSGSAAVRDRQAFVSGLRFGLLGGQVALDGSWDTRDPERHAFDLAYDVRDLEIAPTAEAVETVDQLAPVARFCEGRFRTQLRLTGRLDRNLEPELATLNGRGKVSSARVTVRGFGPLEEAGRVLALDRLKAPTFRDVDLTVVIADGRVDTDPFDLAVEGVALTVDGSLGVAERDLDYDVAVSLPTALFGGQARERVGSLLGVAGGALSDLALPERLDGWLRVGGTVERPTVKPVFAGGGTNLVDAVKEQVIDEVTEEVTERVDEARAAAIAAAEAERDRLVAEAGAQAERLKATAAQEAARVREAAYAAADAELAKIKNPLARKAAELAAQKAKERADAAEREALAEVDRRADALVEEARRRGDALVREAERASGGQP